MITLLIFTAIVVGIHLLGIAADKSYKYEDWYPPLFVISVFAGIVALMMWLAVPIQRNKTSKNIAAMEATRRTVERSRKTEIDPLERATLTREVIAWNAWLAKEQYDNTHLWDIYVPDEIMNIDPIE